MISIVRKISIWAFLIGLFFTALGLWSIFQERNVSHDPVRMDAGNIENSEGSLVYVEIVGGVLDISRTYEYSLSTKKSDVALSSNYFIPVLEEEDSKVAYILKVGLAPTISDMMKVPEYKGLLRSKDDLPKKIREAYNELFESGDFHYLEATYKPRTLMDKILALKFFIGLLVIGLVVRVLLGRSAVKEQP